MKLCVCRNLCENFSQIGHKNGVRAYTSLEVTACSQIEPAARRYGGLGMGYWSKLLIYFTGRHSVFFLPGVC